MTPRFANVKHLVQVSNVFINLQILLSMQQHYMCHMNIKSIKLYTSYLPRTWGNIDKWCNINTLWKFFVSLYLLSHHKNSYIRYMETKALFTFFDIYLDEEINS